MPKLLSSKNSKNRHKPIQVVLICAAILLSVIAVGTGICHVHATAWDSTEETENHAVINDDTKLSDDALTFTNTETGYSAVIEDDAELLSEDETVQLLNEMKPITTYGNVAFKTTLDNNDSAKYYAADYLHNTFGMGVSSTVFLIDMKNRMIYIYSDGRIYNTITESYADTITDNVYKEASKERYYTCAANAFNQINILLKGERINQPMKHISNILLGIILAVLINYFLVRAFSATKMPNNSDIMESIYVRQNMRNFNAVYEKETRKYSPKHSGKGGSHRGGGGHHSRSGGGGGHRF